MKPQLYSPVHPGAVLKNEIKSKGATILDAADAIGIARSNLSLILNGHASITSEMAIRVSMVLGRTAEFWLNLQMHWDLSQIDVNKIRVKSLK